MKSTPHPRNDTTPAPTLASTTTSEPRRLSVDQHADLHRTIRNAIKRTERLKERRPE
jgi:hypothetical protein